MPTPLGNLTDEERKNGWTRESLAAYLSERECETGFIGVHGRGRHAQMYVQPFVPGNVVTEFVRPRAPIRHESALSRNPHKWGR